MTNPSTITQCQHPNWRLSTKTTISNHIQQLNQLRDSWFRFNSNARLDRPWKKVLMSLFQGLTMLAHRIKVTIDLNATADYYTLLLIEEAQRTPVYLGCHLAHEQQKYWLSIFSDGQSLNFGLISCKEQKDRDKEREKKTNLNLHSFSFLQSISTTYLQR